jgi:hypothetical protein
MCAAGHVLHAGRYVVGWLPCGCPAARGGGHRTWTCLACVEQGRGPESTLYDGRHEGGFAPAPPVYRKPDHG